MLVEKKVDIPKKRLFESNFLTWLIGGEKYYFLLVNGSDVGLTWLTVQFNISKNVK